MNNLIFPSLVDVLKCKYKAAKATMSNANYYYETRLLLLTCTWHQILYKEIVFLRICAQKLSVNGAFDYIHTQ